MADIRTKRIYEPYSQEDGYRVLVDRLWPRGIKKADAHLNEWNKEIPPSSELRKWYAHDKAKFLLFKERYIDELSTHADELSRLAEIAQEQTLTLLYAARDPQNNHAIVLAEVLKKYI